MGNVYSHLPFPGTLEAYRRDLQAYHGEAEGAESKADAEFNAYLRERLIQATDHNMETNLKRSARYYSANTFIAFMIIMVLLSGIPVLLKSIL